MAAPFGIALGSFRLTGRLDQGGMGQVWHGVHAASGLPVAIKLIREDKPELAEPFLDEVRAVARLDHPNIITVLDCGRIDAEAHAASAGRLPLGSPWMVMEYCSGGSIGGALPTSWPSLRETLNDLLAALAYAHARGVLHRDLNPENVLVATAADARPGRKLTDFGLSTPLSHAEPGVVVGTPAYMAPEQLRGELGPQGPWTDLYQLGCLAWALATGAPPFGVDRPAAVLALAHLEVDPPPFNPRLSVPPGFESWLRKLLVKDPRRRLQHAADAANALGSLEGSGAFAAGVPHTWQTPEPARMPARLLDAGLGLHALRPPPFVGRHPERDELWACLREVNQAWSPRVVLVHGAAGVGKSRLVSWVCERAHEMGAAHVLRLDGNDAAAGLSRLAGNAPTTIPLGGVAVVATAPRVKGARAWIEGLATERPVVLWLDDVHRSLELLALAWSLCGDDSAVPALVLMTARADALAEATTEADALAGIAGRADLLRLELGPLPAADERRLLRESLGLSTALTDRVAAESAGNPGVAVATVEHLVARAALRASEVGFDASTRVTLSLPARALTPWSLRLDRALRPFPSPLGRRCLEAAAVLGEPVDEHEWTQLCRRFSLSPPLGLVESLVRQRLLVPTESTGDSIRWVFAQGFLQKSVLESAERAGTLEALHREAAAMLAGQRKAGGTVDLGRVARHLAGCREYGSALDTWLTLMDRTSAAGEWGALAAAVRAGEAVLGIWPAARAEERRARVDIWRAVAGAHGAGDEPGSESVSVAARQLDRVIDEARARSWLEALARALLVRAMLADWLGDGAGQVARLGEARSAAWGLGDELIGAEVELALGRLAARRGEMALAIRHFEDAQSVATQNDNRRLTSELRVRLADVAWRTGDGVRGERMAREVLALAGPRTHRSATALALVVLADVERKRGRTDAAVTGYRRALVIFEELGDHDALAVTVRLGAVLWDAGRVADAAAVVEAGQRAAARAGVEGPGAPLEVMAAALTVVADAPGALTRLESAVARLDRWFCVDLDAEAAIARAASHLESSARARGRAPSGAALALVRRAARVSPPPAG